MNTGMVFTQVPDWAILLWAFITLALGICVILQQEKTVKTTPTQATQRGNAFISVALKTSVFGLLIALASILIVVYIGGFDVNSLW